MTSRAKPKRKKTPMRARSAKTGRMVTKAYAKRHKATTVQERQKKIIWQGWCAEKTNGLMYRTYDSWEKPQLFMKPQSAKTYGKPIRVKLIRA